MRARRAKAAAHLSVEKVAYCHFFEFFSCFASRIRSRAAKPAKHENLRLNSDKVLFSFARGRERCDRNGHAVFLRPRVDFATTGSEITGISTSSTKLK